MQFVVVFFACLLSQIVYGWLQYARARRDAERFQRDTDREHRC